jgi:hypothetical protein
MHKLCRLPRDEKFLLNIATAHLGTATMINRLSKSRLQMQPRMRLRPRATSKNLSVVTAVTAL